MPRHRTTLVIAAAALLAAGACKNDDYQRGSNAPGQSAVGRADSANAAGAAVNTDQTLSPSGQQITGTDTARTGPAGATTGAGTTKRP